MNHLKILKWDGLINLKIHYKLIQLSEKLNLSKHKLLDMALFLGVGFLIGFLWKRYANYFIAGIIFITILIIFNQLDLLLLSINWVKVQECCGVEPARADADILGMLWNWVRDNVLDHI